MSTLRDTHAHWGQTQVLPSPTARRALAVVGFAILTAIAGRVALPLPGTPVPFTFGPLAVMLAGALLGARMGAASQALYLAAGLAGAPVFAAGGGAAYLLGPTGGYLMAYPVAAFVTGLIVGRGALRTVAGLLAGLGVIYAGGVSWIALTVPGESALAAGLLPFVVADLVKVGIAAVVTAQLRPWTQRVLQGPR